MLAIMGSNELLQRLGLNIIRRQIIRTPYGLPSSPIVFVAIGEQEVAFLIRHGYANYLAPHEINYRANIWALKEAKVDNIVSISTVYALNPIITPGQLVVPNDIIDNTYSREHTFFENSTRPVPNMSFEEPYSKSLRELILQKTKSLNIQCHSQAVYACLQGPRLPTGTEIKILKQHGADVLGMTGMPEAILARELDLNYAHVCNVIDQLPSQNLPQNQTALHDIQTIITHL